MAHPQSRPLIFRLPSSSDIPRLVKIEQQAFAPAYYRDHRFTAQNFGDFLKREKMFFVAVAYKGQVIGNLIGDLPTNRLKRHARLDSIAVAPKWQHRKIGRRLAARFLAIARRAGYSAVILEVAVPNIGAQKLFRELGFVKQRTLRKYYSGRIDAIRMIRRLR